MRRIAGIFIFGFITMVSLTGQTCNLNFSGYIFDREDRYPLAYVQVFIQELNRDVFTDDQGFFEFENICPGAYHVTLNHLACSAQNHFIRLTDSEQRKFYLDHQHFLLEEIQVKSPGHGQLNSAGSLKLSEENLLANSGQSLGAILSLLPGVSALQSGSGLAKPVIHGLTGNRIAIYNQGIPLEGQNWGNDHAPEIDPNTLETISVMTNGAVVRYGMQAQGGMIMTNESWQNSDPHWHGNARIGYQTNGRQGLGYIHVRKSLGKSNLSLKGGGQFSGDKKTPDYFLTNTGSRQASFSASWVSIGQGEEYQKLHYGVYLMNNGIFRGAHIGNLSDLELALQRETPFFAGESFAFSLQPPRQNVQHHTLKYSFSKPVPKGYLVNFQAGWQWNNRKEYDVRRGGRSDIPSLFLNLWSQFYEVNLTKENFEMGSQIKWLYNANDPGTGILPLLPDYNQFLMAFYAHKKWKQKVGLIEAGGRFEYTWHQANGNRLLDNRLTQSFVNAAAYTGFQMPVSDKMEFKTNLTIMRRSPYIHELLSNGLHQGVAGIEEGNPGLKQETSAKWTVEIKGESTHHRFSISGYAHYFDQFIYLVPTNELRVTIRGVFPVFRYQSTNAFLAGFSAMSEWELTHHSLWVNQVQYVRAQDVTSGRGLVYTPPIQIKSGYSHTLTKLLFCREVNVGADIVYTGKAGFVDQAIDFAPAPDDYWLLNLNAKFKFGMMHKKDWLLIVKATNVMNRAYRDYLNRLRYFIDEPGVNVTFTLSTNF